MELKVGTLTTRRDFTDVRDVVRAYRLLVEAARNGDGANGAVYNVCSGVDVSIQEIVDGLLAVSGSSVGLEVDPSLVRPVEVPVLRGDPGRLTGATDWVPELPLDETLADVLAYWRAQPA